MSQRIWSDTLWRQLDRLIRVHTALLISIWLVDHRGTLRFAEQVLSLELGVITLGIAWVRIISTTSSEPSP